MTPTPLVELRSRPVDRPRRAARRPAPDGRRDDLVWRSGRLELRFRRSADGPVALTRLVAGSVETHFAHPVPLVEVLAVRRDRPTGVDRLVPAAVGAELRYVAHSVSADGTTIEIVSETPRGIRAAVTLHGRDGAFRSSAVVSNGTGGPVPIAVITSWAAPLGVRLDKGDAPDPAADWDLVEGRVAPGAGAVWSTLPLRSRELLGDPVGYAASPPRGSVVRSSEGAATARAALPAAALPGAALPVAGLRSERQEVTWLWEVASDAPWRWEVGGHRGDCRVTLSGAAPDGASAAALAPGASRSSAMSLVAVGTDLEDAAAALTRGRRALRGPHLDDAPTAAPDGTDAAPVDLLRAAGTAAAAPLSTLPERAATPAPVPPGATPELTAFALVTRLTRPAPTADDGDGDGDDRLHPDQRALVAEATRTADALRDGIACSVPLWPLGLPAADDRWASVAHDAGDAVVVSVWDRGDDAGTAVLSFPSLVGRRVDVTTAFPTRLAAWDAEWEAGRGILTVRSVPGGPSARVLQLRRRS
ncbi:hypothetical protein [Clavibacter michiganensis]|uniref:Uncharacterized protein n=1 Tax=Clavibacter michiganensis TaxID=28447 RepID=A0A251YJB5_9MICO|nr:hypothetical protein [Clavibacter michiganensis]OUE24239.1 hypothetical protein BFL37_10035 [Clavibacter michiganensis]